MERWLIGLNDLSDDKRCGMAKSKMPLIRGNLLTNECNEGPGGGSKRRWPWIEAEFTQALEEQLACLEVLNTEIIWMKSNENIIVTSELIYKDKVFLNLRNMK